MKKLLAICLTLCMLTALLAGCAGNTSDAQANTTPPSTDAVETQPAPSHPLDMITDGYYVYGYYAEGYGDYVYFFRFYEEVPVLGSVFYAGFANNGITFAGTYTVEETPREYLCAENRQELLSENKLTGTAPYTIHFYNWDGTELDACGFDGEHLYNDMLNLAGAGGGEVYYNHDTQGEASQYAATYAGEMGVSYLDFEAVNDKTSTLSLLHNGTYMDLINTIVEGSWSMAPNDQGGYDFTLTPNDSSDTGAVVSVSADQKTAAYRADGSDEVIEMANTATAQTLVGLFAGTWFMESANTDINLSLSLYDDNTCVLVADAFGNMMTLDQGVYEKTADGYCFTLDTMGETASETEDGAVVAAYSAVTGIGAVEAVLTLDPDSVIDAAAEVLFSFVGGYCTFDCYTDNTYKFAFADYGVEEAGTWKFDPATYAFTIIKPDGSEIPASVDETHAMSFTYTAVVNEQLADTFTADSQVWGPALVQH